MNTISTDDHHEHAFMQYYYRFYIDFNSLGVQF